MRHYKFPSRNYLFPWILRNAKNCLLGGKRRLRTTYFQDGNHFLKVLPAPCWQYLLSMTLLRVTDKKNVYLKPNHFFFGEYCSTRFLPLFFASYRASSAWLMKVLFENSSSMPGRQEVQPKLAVTL